MKYFNFLTVAVAIVLALGAQGAQAQSQTDATADGEAQVPGAARDAMSVELNKAEQIERGCQFFLLLRNSTDFTFRTFSLDLYFFDTDGVISRRLLVDTPPVAPDGTQVAAFVATDLQCDTVSQILVNGVQPCEVAGGAAPDCYSLLSLGNRTDITFFK